MHCNNMAVISHFLFMNQHSDTNSSTVCCHASQVAALEAGYAAELQRLEAQLRASQLQAKRLETASLGWRRPAAPSDTAGDPDQGPLASRPGTERGYLGESTGELSALLEETAAGGGGALAALRATHARIMGSVKQVASESGSEKYSGEFDD